MSYSFYHPAKKLIVSNWGRYNSLIGEMLAREVLMWILLKIQQTCWLKKYNSFRLLVGVSFPQMVKMMIFLPIKAHIPLNM